MTAQSARAFSARWLIAPGDFFFKNRNALFPAVILLVTLGMRPHVLWNDWPLDRRLGQLGVLAAVLGELTRLTTIGFEYIERGGKNKQVWASRLVQGGVYGLCRNPMYVGNILIVIGMCLLARAPVAFVTIVPLFFYIYAAIVATEENFLRKKFGKEFEGYCRQVPAFIPHFREFPSSFEGMRYNWKRAIRQDLSTFVGVLFGLGLVPYWRALHFNGWVEFQSQLPRAALVTGLILVFYGFVFSLKKSGKLS